MTDKRTVKKIIWVRTKLPILRIPVVRELSISDVIANEFPNTPPDFEMDLYKPTGRIDYRRKLFEYEYVYTEKR